MAQPYPIKDHAVKIQSIIDEAPNVKTFRVAAQDAPFYCGQFYMVSFADDATLKRAYSIASSPAQTGFLDITLNKVGVFTTKLFDAQIGDALNFKGPFGKFFFDPETDTDCVLIGGGLGITPLMSIIRLCNDKKLSTKLQLIYSVKTAEDIVYHDEIKTIKGENANFDYEITLTQADDSWSGKKGRINDELCHDCIQEYANKTYFLCGSKEFVQHIISILESKGVTKEHIKTDVWGH